MSWNDTLTLSPAATRSVIATLPPAACAFVPAPAADDLRLRVDRERLIERGAAAARAADAQRGRRDGLDGAVGRLGGSFGRGGRAGAGDCADFRRVQCAVHVVIRHFNVVADLHDFAEFGTGQRRLPAPPGSWCRRRGLQRWSCCRRRTSCRRLWTLTPIESARHSRHRAARGLGWLSERGSGGPACDYECSEGKCYERPSHIGLLSE